MKDTARVLGRMFDGIEYRGFAQESIEILGEFAGVPVWNGLTDTWHPTQMLADIMTMTDHSTKPLPEVSFCYLGDGRNNTANSLMATGAMLGMDARICAPAALQPPAEVRGIAAGLAAGSGARLLVTDDIDAAVAGADFLYTDVWLSMGEPEDQWAARIGHLLPYQVNAGVMKATGNTRGPRGRPSPWPSPWAQRPLGCWRPGGTRPAPSPRTGCTSPPCGPPRVRRAWRLRAPEEILARATTPLLT